MNINLKHIVLLSVLLIFCVSCTYAANDTADVSSSDDKISVPDTQVNKVITKTNMENKAVKTANVTEVSSFSDLRTQLNDTATEKTINLKKGTYKVTDLIYMYDRRNKTIVLNGNGAVIDGSGSKSFLVIASNNNVTINDLVIKNTKGTDRAGGIVVLSNASLKLNNCNFTNDVSTGTGGAITNTGKTTINNCVFTSNTAKKGGAIWSNGEQGGYLKIDNCKFIRNKANYQNDHDKTAVIYYVATYGEKNIISNSLFENNDGKATHAYKANSLVFGNTFKNIVLKAPTQTIRGSVLDNYEGDIKIVNNVFTNITISAKNVKGGLLYNEIGTSSFENNKVSNLKVSATEKTDSLNGGILFNRNSSLTVSENTVTNVNNGYRVHGGDLYNNIGKLYVAGNTFNPSNTASKLIRGKYIYNDKGGLVNYDGNNFKGGETNIYNLGTVKQTAVSAVKRESVVTVDKVYGVLGDSITFTARVKDIYGMAATGGNIVFKLNGKTLKTDGTFDSSAAANKVSVTNGIAKVTVTATKAIRGAKTISASYSGTSKYYANSTKGVTTAEIALRKAAITVTASPSTQKQYDVIKFTAKVYDVTKNTKSSTPANNAASYVFFKVNGVSLKDSNGKLIKAAVNNGVATYDYVVPAGMSAINPDKTTRFYNVTAGYVNPNYYPDTKNMTKFNVYKSNITITTSKVVANMTSRKLQIVGDIRDFKNNYVIGKNQVSVKINGKTMSINGKTSVDVINGKLSITMDIPDSVGNVKSVTLVTGSRMAYEGYRTTISNIIRV